MGLKFSAPIFYAELVSASYLKDPEASSGNQKAAHSFSLVKCLRTHNNTTFRPQHPDDHCLTIHQLMDTNQFYDSKSI